MLRACSSSVRANDVLNPRTPVSAATPIATDSSTKKNFAFPARSSRHAIRPAVNHESAGFVTIGVSPELVIARSLDPRRRRGRP